MALLLPNLLQNSSKVASSVVCSLSLACQAAPSPAALGREYVFTLPFENVFPSFQELTDSRISWADERIDSSEGIPRVKGQTDTEVSHSRGMYRLVSTALLWVGRKTSCHTSKEYGSTVEANICDNLHFSQYLQKTKWSCTKMIEIPCENGLKHNTDAAVNLNNRSVVIVFITHGT